MVPINARDAERVNLRLSPLARSAMVLGENALANPAGLCSNRNGRALPKANLGYGFIV